MKEPGERLGDHAGEGDKGRLQLHCGLFAMIYETDLLPQAPSFQAIPLPDAPKPAARMSREQLALPQCVVALELAVMR